MSDKKYPYIGRSELTDRDYLVYSDYCFYSFASEDFYTDINQDNLKNITREYLTNTYGKCESQEHANFICKLAENHGFNLEIKYRKERTLFNFYDDILDFWTEEDSAKSEGEKLIHLPLPPKEKEMSEVKPIYTKEMHERGELPPIGSVVKWGNYEGCEVLINKPDVDNCIVISKGGEYLPVRLSRIKPTPTIEDELVDFLVDTVHLEQGERVRQMLDKFNITPKGE